MNIKKSSWHYKFISFYMRESLLAMPKTDCSYYWNLIGCTILSLFIAGIVVIMGTIMGTILTEIVVAYFFGLYTWIVFGEVFPWEANDVSPFIVLNFLFIIIAIIVCCRPIGF